MGFKTSRVSEEKFSNLCRRAAAQGAVLLKNDNKVLPLLREDNIAIFGRCQIDYYRSGTGSGGAVNTAYTTNLLEGLMNSNAVSVNEELAARYKKWVAEHPVDDGGGGWACEPWYQAEMPIDSDIAEKAAAVSNKALVVIGRTAGEDKDNAAEEGSYLMTAAEKEMLYQVCSKFEQVIVVLNVSGIIDMGFMQEENCSAVKAVVYAWQGGMEGGNGIADVLTGKEVFQGKLTDTIACSIQAYPSDKNHGGTVKNIYQEDIYVGYRYFETFHKEEVLFPFGFGMSYTEFEISDSQIKQMGKGTETEFVFTCNVKNIGTEYNGREIVQIYAQGPQTGIGRPLRVLVGFAKTHHLKCLEEEKIQIHIPVCRLAVFDDSGESGFANSYILEKGIYKFFAGENVRDAQQVMVDGADGCQFSETMLLQECEEAMAPSESFERMRAALKPDGTMALEYETAPIKTVMLEKRIRENLPQEIPYTGDRGFKLKDVAEGTCTMEDFIAQLSVEDMAAMVRGEGMCSIKVTPGTAAAFGGVSDNLLGFGIPVGCCADGPSGIRMDNGTHAAQVPIGTLIACTWDEALAEELFAMVGAEMAENKIDTLLGPGINIHRHPLNGRNFEYFSEDPLLTGKIASAMIRGISRNGVHATIKHFACNSQEQQRHMVNAVVSQRALREIYLKAFEIAVKEGGARSIMTSYNPVNGYWAASNYDLSTTILRKEWGYTGIVMTDWWADMNDVVNGGESSKKRTADMIRAQNDVYMVVNNNGAEINAGGDDTVEALSTGRLTAAELQRSAVNICRFLMATPAFARGGNGMTQILEIKAMQEQPAEKENALHENRIIWDTNEPSEKYFYLSEAGEYDVIVRIMSPQTDRAQTVCKAVANGQELSTFQTNGTEGKWITQKLLRVRLEKGAYQIELQFPKSGMHVDFMEFRLCNNQ
ncbi:MAG: glycoside hydrolase family 3 C-terminal domain-containing protein [Lachnospiraceae bacterium]|nr:glycoside hydrolase family 3 C-terminal domain-containing protein [Lachnospiraceae bacterium]